MNTTPQCCENCLYKNGHPYINNTPIYCRNEACKCHTPKATTSAWEELESLLENTELHSDQIERIVVMFRKVEEKARKDGMEEALSALEVMAKTPSPYERNHGMPSHGGPTLTNAYRNGYNQSIVDAKVELQARINKG